LERLCSAKKEGFNFSTESTKKLTSHLQHSELSFLSCDGLSNVDFQSWDSCHILLEGTKVCINASYTLVPVGNPTE